MTEYVYQMRVYAELYRRQTGAYLAHCVLVFVGELGDDARWDMSGGVLLPHDGKLPTLPKGIPAPTQSLPTSSSLYIGGKQWNKVKESLRNLEDVLIAEGTPVLDPKHQAITVFVTNASTKLLQQTQREQQKASRG